MGPALRSFICILGFLLEVFLSCLHQRDLLFNNAHLEMVFGEVFSLYYSKVREVVSQSGLFQFTKVTPKVVSYLPQGTSELPDVIFPHEDFSFSSRELILWTSLRVFCLTRGDPLFLITARRARDIVAPRVLSLLDPRNGFLCYPVALHALLLLRCCPSRRLYISLLKRRCPSKHSFPISLLFRDLTSYFHLFA